MTWEAIGAVGEVLGALGVKVIEHFHHGDPNPVVRRLSD